MSWWVEWMSELVERWIGWMSELVERWMRADGWEGG